VTEASAAWWPHLRAAFVAFHLAAITFQALPAADGGLKRSAWADPTVQAEFDAWYARFAALGYPRDRVTFEEDLWSVATGWSEARKAVIRPLTPYYKGFGTYQTWRMFVAPHRFPARMQIEVMENNRWRTVYREGERGGWLGPILDHDRVRSGTFHMSWPHQRAKLDTFADWLAARAYRDFPEASRVRVRFTKSRSRSPAEVRAGTKVEPVRGPQRTVVLR
jgi:hypothetical protein